MNLPSEVTKQRQFFQNSDFHILVPSGVKKQVSPEKKILKGLKNNESKTTTELCQVNNLGEHLLGIPSMSATSAQEEIGFYLLRECLGKVITKAKLYCDWAGVVMLKLHLENIIVVHLPPISLDLISSMKKKILLPFCGHNSSAVHN